MPRSPNDPKNRDEIGFPPAHAYDHRFVTVPDSIGITSNQGFAQWHSCASIM